MFCSDEWNGVTPGSVLNVRFTKEPGVGIGGNYRVIRSDGSREDMEINSGSFPLAQTVSEGERHEVEFRAELTGGEADVSLVATVVRPDQTIQGQPYRCSGTLTEQDPLCTVQVFANGAS